MPKAHITIVYKQIIDAHSESLFERQVFAASYQEFLLKAQAYNADGQFKTFSQLKANDGRANSLHYKLSFAVANLIEGLNKVVPHIIDNLGNALLFDVAEFELIESDLSDITAHKVAIKYTTNTLTLHEIIGEYLLLSNTHATDAPVKTFMVKVKDGVGIVGYGQEL